MRFASLLFLVAWSTVSAAPADWRVDGVSRIVALSDVHGAYSAMVGALQSAAVIDGDTAWSGGTTHLVVVGDLLDRGPRSRDAMDLLMRLEDEATAAGGAVHVLIGNHEAMNLTGDLRYVSAAEYAAFADEESPEERERVFAAWLQRKEGEDTATLRAEFDTRYPRGYFAHRRAFAADGIYGRWLLSKPVIVVLNRTAFVHGGLTQMVTRYGLEGINGQLVGELKQYVRDVATLRAAGVLLPTDDERLQLMRLERFTPLPELDEAAVAAARRLPRLAESDLFAADGPLWYRGDVYCSELVEQDRLDAALQALDADRVVIGHTPTPNHGMLERIDGQVIEVDTGMLHDYYGGSGHALILEGDAVSYVSEASADPVPVSEHPRRVGARPAGLNTPAELEDLLRNGELGPAETDENGERRLSVSRGDLKVNAVFHAAESSKNNFEVAAYRLDRLLELDMVPVTVVREVDGELGSLQYAAPDTPDEAQRSAQGEGGSAYCALPDQWAAMYTFDALIYNEGRSQNRMLYSTDIWQLLLVGHDRAFGTRKGRPRHLQKAPIVIGKAWREALGTLDEKTLEADLGEVLDTRRRRALLNRRDELLDSD
jgi:Calcineurin-like phosphoesterase